MEAAAGHGRHVNQQTMTCAEKGEKNTGEDPPTKMASGQSQFANLRPDKVCVRAHTRHLKGGRARTHDAAEIMLK